ncbi:MAG: deoxyribose-phosphate aldolase [Candidatus Omnitrophica bacterium]|nr:deoxyribose-phosphate aldolase [Candidatus Omnitrophota bacterium]
MTHNELEKVINEGHERVNALGLEEHECACYPEQIAINISSPQDVRLYIEHTILKPEANETNIINLCAEAKECSFKGVCVNPAFAETACKAMGNNEGLVITVVGFPLGMNTTHTKVIETEEAVSKGVDEIDMVIAVGYLKSQQFKKVYEDIRAVVVAAKNKPVKVILETCLLSSLEKVIACLLVKYAGAAFVKTSTGFNTAGATVEDVQLMRKVIGERMGIKAAGGIRDFETAKGMILVGANRLGCSSSVGIAS